MQIKPTQLLHPSLNKVGSISNYFSNAKEDYNDFRKQGIYEQIENSSIIVYQIEGTKGEQYSGIAASIPISEYEADHIKKHEATLTPKEEQQLRLLKERQAQVKPVLLTYPKVTQIEAWISHIQKTEPIFKEVVVKKMKHRLWKVSHPSKIQEIQQLFQQYVPNTYIADGHHRTAATNRWNAGKSNKADLYCALFSSDQIEILPFNRVVDGVEERTLKAFLKEMDELCDIREIEKPFIHPPKHCLQMYVRGQWYAFVWKKQILASCKTAVEKLDPYLLDHRILTKVMQIDDIRDSRQVKYVGGLEGSIKKMKALVDKEKDRIGFYLPSIRMDDFLTVVNSGEVLPPKSTWFEPRMLNGLLVYSLE